MSSTSPTDDFRPTANWKNLRLRAELLRQTRAFFDQRGFLEVETPILSADTVVDRHLDPFCVAAGDEPAGPGTHLWLQTSPELAMKRLLAAGGEAIYQVTPAFRRGERGRLHNPEFTMVEWYRVGDRMDEGIELLGDLCRALLQRGPAERLSYREAFERHVGVDPHAAQAPALAAAAKRHAVAAPASLRADDRDGWLDLLLVECVQPHLGVKAPAILYDYPAGQAALARVRDDDPPVAERFELFASGIELANGYHELVDPAVLRRRNAENNALREADGRNHLPGESRLLDAMEAGLPPCTGVAMGFDRVVMLAAGARGIDEVIAFPFERA
ncbi:MAG: EF-P lysine aminoacylase EpmA [Planctomycetota bacterium]|jgi:lysyl-tRNA synthetase class 2